MSELEMKCQSKQYYTRIVNLAVYRPEMSLRDIVNDMIEKVSAMFMDDAAYEKNLRNKISVFSSETTCKKAIHLTLVSAGGLAMNEYAGIIQNTINGDDLFRQ